MLKKPAFLAILAAILGIATTAGTLLTGFKKVAAEDHSSGYTGRPGSPKAKAWDFWTAEIETLSEELKTERLALEKRAKDLDATVQRVAAEKQELQKQRAELEALKEEITRAIPEIQASEKQNIKTLAKTYSSMKPSQAVSVLAEMDDSSVVKLLAVMKPEVVGTIFQEMARVATPEGMPARAARLSDQLRLIRKEDKEATVQ